MKVNMLYFSNGGNTEAMAEAVREALEARSYEVNVYTDETDGETFADADLLIFGSPACGTEEVDDSVIQPTINSIPSLEGKRIFLFGSYGWGGGTFMETWAEEMTGKGAVLAAEPVVCLEAPDDDVIAQLKQAVDSF